jgi:hypothetical protein
MMKASNEYFYHYIRLSAYLFIISKLAGSSSRIRDKTAMRMFWLRVIYSSFTCFSGV